MKFADTFVAGNTVIEIIFDDITNANTEIIVNSVCNLLHIGRGVSGAIYEKGGKEIYDELHLNTLQLDEKVMEGSIYKTSSGNLPYKYIFHAISSNCRKGTNASILKSCVENTIKIARENNIKSIGFPAFGTGEMNFSINHAAEVLIDTVIENCFKNDYFDRIVFYLFRPDAFTTFFRKAVKATIQVNQTNTPEINKSIENLNKCEFGLYFQDKYENIVASIFKDVFIPPLTDYQTCKRQNGHLFRDLIFPNYCSDGFWNIIDRRYDVKNLIISCYNEKNPDIKTTLSALNQYFEKNIYGKFGIITCRQKYNSDEIDKTIFSSYKKYGSVILVLDDFDVSQLVELKKTKYEPEKYLQRKLGEYLLMLSEIDKKYSSNIIDVVREYTIKGELQGAINSLLDYTKTENHGLMQNSVILSSRLQLNENNYYIRGLISYDDYKLEFNRIVNAIEMILNDIKCN